MSVNRSIDLDYISFRIDTTLVREVAIPKSRLWAQCQGVMGSKGSHSYVSRTPSMNSTSTRCIIILLIMINNMTGRFQKAHFQPEMTELTHATFIPFTTNSPSLGRFWTEYIALCTYVPILTWKWLKTGPLALFITTIITTVTITFISISSVV